MMTTLARKAHEIRGPSSFPVLIAALLASAPVAAQVRGTVTDSAGRPLSDAVVDLWGPTERVGRVVTGAAGRFEFKETVGGSRLAVRRIGSRAVIMPVGAGDTMMTVVLHPGLVAVEGTEVRGGACPSRDDRNARSRWIAAAQHYRPVSDSLWLSSVFKLVQERVPTDDVGRPVLDSSGYGWTAGRLVMFSIRSWQTRIAQVGYLAPDPESQSFGQSFQGLYHQRWVSPEFGTESVFSGAPDGTIRFCSKEQVRPWIEGEMRIGEDGGIVWVRWRFRSRSALPATGGEALFLPPASDSAMLLLPTSETIWQERPYSMAAQRTIEYREWRLTREEPHWP